MYVRQMQAHTDGRTTDRLWYEINIPFFFLRKNHECKILFNIGPFKCDFIAFKNFFISVKIYIVVTLFEVLKILEHLPICF